MGSLITVVVFVAVLVQAIPAVRRQWRVDRAGFIKALKLVGAYALFCAAGMGISLLVLPEPGPGNEAAAGILTAFMLGWICYGALWLVRLVPREQPLPAWVDRPGVIDIPVLVALGGCLAWLN